MSDGGYPGLVFLLARTADNPKLHERFFAEWTDMHDVTRRCLAVITPSPGSITLEHRDPWRAGREEDVNLCGVQCLGDTRRLTEPAWNARSCMDIDARPDIVAPVLPGELQSYHKALTVAVSETRRFFGVSEALLPCTVFVSMFERRVFIVALDEMTSLYGLLKRIRIELEPVLNEIDMAEAELAEAKAVRAEHHHRVGDLRWKVWSVNSEWHAQLARLAQDLLKLTGSLADEEAELCRQVAADLASGQELTPEKRASARTLAHRLSEARLHGKMPRRLRRAIAKLEAGYPGTHDVAARMAQAVGEQDAHQRTIGRLKARVDDLGRELRLGAALVTAAKDFGLTSVGERGLLPWRELAWPIEVLAREERNSPQAGIDGTRTMTENQIHGTTARNIVQANTIGAVHFHQHGKERPGPADRQSPTESSS